MGIELLKKLVELAGTKLPQIWPHIVQIGISLQAIFEILQDPSASGYSRSAALSQDSLDLLAKVEAQGIDVDDPQEVFGGFEQVV